MSAPHPSRVTITRHAIDQCASRVFGIAYPTTYQRAVIERFIKRTLKPTGTALLLKSGISGYLYRIGRDGFAVVDDAHVVTVMSDQCYFCRDNEVSEKVYEESL